MHIISIIKANNNMKIISKLIKKKENKNQDSEKDADLIKQVNSLIVLLT